MFCTEFERRLLWFSWYSLLHLRKGFNFLRMKWICLESRLFRWCLFSKRSLIFLFSKLFALVDGRCLWVSILFLFRWWWLLKELIFSFREWTKSKQWLSSWYWLHKGIWLVLSFFIRYYFLIRLLIFKQSCFHLFFCKEFLCRLLFTITKDSRLWSWCFEHWML